MAIYNLLNTTKAEVEGLLKHPQRNYLRFSIKKRSGKRRIIDAPSPDLKKLQRAVLDNILYKFLPHPVSHGFTQYRSPRTNAVMHQNAAVVLNVDLKNFFPSINAKRVRKLFAYLSEQTKHDANPLKFTDEECKILAKLCTLNEHVPQGAPTSPMISNLICLGMDKELKNMSDLCDCTITRYADDITVSSGNKDFDIGKLILPIAQAVHKYGFVLNRDKTRILRRHKRQEVTGVVVNEGTNAPKAYRRLVRAQVHNYVNAKLPNPDEYRKIRGKIEWISSLNPLHGQQLLKKLGSKARKNSKTFSSITPV